MNKITLYGADWCPDCQRAKAFLKKHDIDYDFIDVDLDKSATQLVESINNGKRIIPTMIIDDKTLTNPDNPTLAKALGINEDYRIILFGADWCPDCRRAKHFLTDNHINYQFIDVDKYQWATDKVESINQGKRIIPTLLINGEPLTNPDNPSLVEVLKINVERVEHIYDTVIIGGGAAGLTTAIYAQRDKLETVILEKKNLGGNAFLTQKIENYPGFQDISGPALMEKMGEQAAVYGAKIELGVEVTGLEKKEGLFEVSTNSGVFKGKTVVLSTGSTYRTLKIPGEEALIGGGIHFCATCDGAFYREKEVIVIGGGNSALEESIFLSSFVKKVKIVHRKAAFSASATYIEKLPSIDNIETYMNRTSLSFEADEKDLFQALVIKNNETGEEERLTADGVFIFIGLIPNTKFLKGVVDLDEQGQVLTSGLNQTNIVGVFAAGDVRKGAIAQVAAATGEGVVASYGVRDYLQNHV